MDKGEDSVPYVVVAIVLAGLVLVLANVTGNYLNLSQYASNAPSAQPSYGAALPVYASYSVIAPRNVTAVGFDVYALQLESASQQAGTTQLLGPLIMQLGAESGSPFSIGTVGAFANATNATLRMVYWGPSFEIDGVEVNMSPVNQIAQAQISPAGGAAGHRGIWLHMYPTIVPVYSYGNTSFSLVWSLYAAPYPAPQPYAQGAPGINITSASLSHSSNSVSFVLRLKVSNATVAADLQNVLVFGHMAVVAHAPGGGELSCYSPAPEPNATIQRICTTARSIDNLGLVDIAILSNGSILAPVSSGVLRDEGFQVSPNSYVELNYTRALSYANSTVQVMPVAGRVYTVVVQGASGAVAEANVTAS